MKRVRIRKNALMLSLIASFLMAIAIVPSYAQMATLAVEPFETVQAAGTFYIDITVDDVEAMFGFQFKLAYDTSVLTATDFGSWSPFDTPQGSPPGGEINDAEGYVAVAFSYPMAEPDGLTTDVPVYMAWVEFTVDATGASPLQIEDSVIADVYGNTIGHVAMCGEFRTTAGLPMAKFTSTPEDPLEGEEVTFTSESTDLGTSIVAWEWDFGDGNTATGNVVTHTYTEAGEYTVTLTVTDDDTNTDSHSKTTTVSAPPPPGADLLTAEAEYRKLNVAARGTCKLFAEVINLDEEEAVLVRMMFFVYDEGVTNLGTIEVVGTVGPGETEMFEGLFNGTDSRWKITHAKLEWIFRAECWYNDFDLPNGDHHWAQIEEPTEIWFAMIGKDPHL